MKANKPVYKLILLLPQPLMLATMTWCGLAVP